MLLVVVLCSVVGEYAVVIIVLSVMRFVGGVLLRVVCIFRHVVLSIMFIVYEFGWRYSPNMVCVDVHGKCGVVYL